METFDEKQLLKAISEGDEKAFKTFFLYYYPRIKGFKRPKYTDKRQKSTAGNP